MASNTQYFKIIRKTTTAFASLFNNITLVRYNDDGSENQRFIVPVDFADKEKYVKRIQGDPELLKKIQISLPRISYQLTGFKYDPSRKLNTNNMNFGSSSSADKVLAQYNPVPYDFEFGVTIYTRTIEDSNQILEHILPYFTPDYSLRLNLIPEMGITKTIPIVLNSIQPIIDSEGSFDSEVRTVMWTLGFTVKGFIFGAIKDSPIIKNVSTNIVSGTNKLSNDDAACCSSGIDSGFIMLPSGYGNYFKHEFVYQGFNFDNAYATGKVVNWAANTLFIGETCGEFKLNQPIVGVESLSVRVPTEYASNDYTQISVTTTPNPPTASANSYWTANTIITEY
jgi:T4-like virus Myoviridae tail sheath stabiliser